MKYFGVGAGKQEGRQGRCERQYEGIGATWHDNNAECTRRPSLPRFQPPFPAFYNDNFRTPAMRILSIL